MKFMTSAIITLASVVAFANTSATTATTTTTTAPVAAPAHDAHTATTTTTKETKEVKKDDTCAKLTDAKEKAACEKKATKKM